MPDRYTRFICRQYGPVLYVIEDTEHDKHGTQEIVPLAAKGDSPQHGILELLAHGANIILDSALKLGCAADELADVLDPADYIDTVRDAVESMREMIEEVTETGLTLDLSRYAAKADEWEATLAHLPDTKNHKGHTGEETTHGS